jgi:WD40 repeat protein
VRLTTVPILTVTACALLLTQGCAQKSNSQTVVQQNSPSGPDQLLQREEETCEHNEITGLAVSPDGRQILTSSPALGVRLFDLESGKLIRSFGNNPQSMVGRVAFSPDSRRALSYGYGIPIHVWDVESGQEIVSVAGNKSGTERAVFTPDGQRILSCDLEGGTIHVWNAQNGQEVDSLKVGSDDEHVDVGFSPDCRRALVTHMESDTACLWDVEHKIKLLCSTTRNVQVQISGDGSYGIFNRGDRILRLLEIGSGREIPAPKLLKGAMIESISKDARRILVSTEGEAKMVLRLVESSSGREVRLETDEDETHLSAIFTPSEGYAVGGNFNGGLCLWNLKNGKRVRCFGKKDTAISHR